MTNQDAMIIKMFEGFTVEPQSDVEYHIGEAGSLIQDIYFIGDFQDGAILVESGDHLMAEVSPSGIRIPEFTLQDYNCTIEQLQRFLTICQQCQKAL